MFITFNLANSPNMILLSADIPIYGACKWTNMASKSLIVDPIKGEYWTVLIMICSTNKSNLSLINERLWKP